MIVSALALVAAASQPQETPQAFVARAYSQYRKHPYGSLEHPAQWYAQRLAAAINEDTRLAHGEIGYLEGDPLCDCQDYDHIAERITSFRRLSVSRVVVGVRVDLGFAPQDAPNLRLTLDRTADGWRIADVASAEEPSLLRTLQRSNSKARSHH